MQKTAIILWTTDGAEYYLAEGDHSRFNGTFANSDMPLAEELFDFLFEEDSSGDRIHKLVELETIRESLLDKSTVLIECGYHF